MASENNYKLNPDYVTISGTEIGYRAYMPDGQLIPALTQVIVNDTWNEHPTVQLTMYCNIATDKMKFNTEDTPMKLAYREREEILKKRIEELTDTKNIDPNKLYIKFEKRKFETKRTKILNHANDILESVLFSAVCFALVYFAIFIIQVPNNGFYLNDLAFSIAFVSGFYVFAIHYFFVRQGRKSKA